MEGFESVSPEFDFTSLTYKYNAILIALKYILRNNYDSNKYKLKKQMTLCDFPTIYSMYEFKKRTNESKH